MYQHLRHEVATTFNDDPTYDVLLLTTKVGGFGLNLPGMSEVVPSPGPDGVLT